jgi:hypothetical protein
MESIDPFNSGFNRTRSPAETGTINFNGLTPLISAIINQKYLHEESREDLLPSQICIDFINSEEGLELISQGFQPTLANYLNFKPEDANMQEWQNYPIHAALVKFNEEKETVSIYEPTFGFQESVELSVGQEAITSSTGAKFEVQEIDQKNSVCIIKVTTSGGRELNIRFFKQVDFDYLNNTFAKEFLKFKNRVCLLRTQIEDNGKITEFSLIFNQNTKTLTVPDLNFMDQELPFEDFLGYYGHYLENIFGIGIVETLQQFYNSVKVAEKKDFYQDWGESTILDNPTKKNQN